MDSIDANRLIEIINIKRSTALYAVVLFKGSPLEIAYAGRIDGYDRVLDLIEEMKSRKL